jgi:hypothetical protein
MNFRRQSYGKILFILKTNSERNVGFFQL